MIDFAKLADRYERYVIEQRRWLHQHAELSWEERETTEHSFFWGTTFPVGSGEHTWEYTSCAAAHLGLEGMLYAAKALAGTAYDFYQDPSVLERAKKEFVSTTKGEQYSSPYDE